MSQGQRGTRSWTRRGRLLGDLETRLDEVRAELKAHEQTIEGLAQSLDNQRSKQLELEHRLIVLESTYASTLSELAANRRHHEQHLKHLEHSVETQRDVLRKLERILDPDEQ